MTSLQQTLGKNLKVSTLWDQDEGQTKDFTSSMQNSTNTRVLQSPYLQIGGGQAVTHVNTQVSGKL